MINVANSHPTWLPQTQTWMHSLITSLPDEQITSHIYCNKTEHLDQFQLPLIYDVKRARPAAFLWNRVVNKLKLKPLRVNLLKAYIDKNKIDLVHSHFGYVGATDSESLKQTDTKHIVTFYGFDVSRLPLVQPSILQDYAKMFSTVDRVLCEGPFMANQVVTKLGCAKDKVTVQRLGVDLKRFEFRPRTWKPGKELRILIAGAFKEKKGIPIAIRGIGELAKMTNVSVSIIGDAIPQQASLAEKDAIELAIQETGLESKVTRHGFQPHSRMIELAYDHHLFVSPSIHAADGDSEGGAPVTLIEMAATGMPIVSSTHCDIPSVVIDNETGWLAKERDIDSLVERLESAIACHHSWPEMLKAGRARMETHFDLAKQGDKLARLYEGIF